MDQQMKYAFPAGDELDDSDEDWHLGSVTDVRTPSCYQDTVTNKLLGDDDVTLLKQAASKGDVEAVERLLDKGMDVDTKLSYDWTLLMWAVNVAHYDLAKVLLDRGASANYSKDNWTVLMAGCVAAASEDEVSRCVELLLSRNADPNMGDSSQMTCLMFAARDGRAKVINILVSHGANVNLQDSKGYTALFFAVQYNQEEAVLKLLQLGANKTTRNKFNQSPADLAEQLKHKQIFKILTSSTSSPFSSNSMTLLKSDSEPLTVCESANKLNDVELFLYGLGLSHLTEIMIDHDITLNQLLTMEENELQKIGVIDPQDKEKLMSAVEELQPDQVDLSITELGESNTGAEELHNFLMSVHQQCSYLSDLIHDVTNRFPQHPSQLVFPLDPKKEAQTVCNQLVIQTEVLQKEVICLRKLLSQMEEAKDCCPLPKLSSAPRRPRHRTALGIMGVSLILLLVYGAAGGKVHRQMLTW
ncbi:ankyrin repeat, SAM and basic leucine zipper domain-containing protein 1 [Synchiropus splendidus]|uniref:ankyrin repeat, SAM and basic leucine zipper domain-containing protein 1 n=1 Tax=Synchiropus splendidus TaxID=270530 RepID=UPI00237DBFEF|nr:ankyrin repeat, SAM and basic leucine zipper domain-containing protein 1 [Synchiropus splendidus]